MSGWEQLQHILDCPINAVEVPISDHPELTGLQPGTLIDHLDGYLQVIIQSDNRSIRLLQVHRDNWTETEKQLISWSVARSTQVAAKGSTKQDAKSEAERNARALGEWIVRQSATGLALADPIPDDIAQDGRLYAEMIPFLLETEQAAEAAAFRELQKLLVSFLDEEVIVIPLKGQEWLILAPVSLVRDTLEERDEQADALEESLESIGSGLYEMLASEWIGECHLAVGRPMKPVKSAVASVVQLQETIELGRVFQVGANMHVPWNMHLERLLASIPEPVRVRYVEQALGRSDVFMETETMSTLETFFALDCNVSETAKKLYIHRNTLLYRLDKLKQETGLDVRVFRDAVLMKIILLLYKVTKRA
ncbi:PucR family transcriptional regulator [Paenibacillus sp. MMS18-CY102]|uniref:PucR family transcriptional regulator n=1 Tax=Paenibacillus sp. MMS18-CY102 TaxID=2682849 RepID=UPI0013665054|nr:helix-turn-helix domain-containing protein [Paenibacillus sp. MMS18-CY102]MWC30842.1 PucR family transcriptional regulator [Paenibacillus sp. MMS18-CY102]